MDRAKIICNMTFVGDLELLVMQDVCIYIEDVLVVRIKIL
jgi:hypothetical protein